MEAGESQDVEEQWDAVFNLKCLKHKNYVLMYLIINLLFHCGIVFVCFYLVNVGILISRRKMPSLTEAPSLLHRSNGLNVADLTLWLLLWILVAHLFLMQWYDLSFMFALQLFGLVILTMSVTRISSTGENASSTVFTMFLMAVLGLFLISVFCDLHRQYI